MGCSRIFSACWSSWRGFFVSTAAMIARNWPRAFDLLALFEVVCSLCGGTHLNRKWCLAPTRNHVCPLKMAVAVKCPPNYMHPSWQFRCLLVQSKRAKRARFRFVKISFHCPLIPSSPDTIWVYISCHHPTSTKVPFRGPDRPNTPRTPQCDDAIYKARRPATRTAFPHRSDDCLFGITFSFCTLPLPAPLSLPCIPLSSALDLFKPSSSSSVKSPSSKFPSSTS